MAKGIQGVIMTAVDTHRYLFSVDEFARMGEAGIFAEDDRVELIGGEVHEMTPIGSLHAGVVSRLTELFITQLAGRAHVSAQNPIRLDRHTELQPDLVVARRRRSYYTDRHPDADDAFLVVEVAHSSLRFDRGRKVPLYAKAGIPQTRLVDLAARTVTVYADPGSDGYAREEMRHQEDRVRIALRHAVGQEDTGGAPVLDILVGDIFS